MTTDSDGKYVKCDYEPGIGYVVSLYESGVLIYGRNFAGHLKAEAEARAARIAREAGCDWGTNY